MFRLWLLSAGLLLAAWIINSNIAPRIPPLVNYGETVYFDPAKILSPSTKEEILAIVNGALENDHHIRVVGSAHSQSSIAVSNDIMISLHRYRGVFKFDEQANQVTVKAGTTIGEIIEYLDKRGLALSVLPAILDQTIAGAISTATHGTGVNFGNIATMVTGLELITGEGETLSLSENNHPDIFNAALVSVGLLGIITKVTLQCVPAFNLEESVEPVSLNSCEEQLPSLAVSAEHVKFWIQLYSDRCAIFRMYRTDKEVNGNGVMRILDLKMRLMEPFLLLSSWLPSHTPTIMQFISDYINIFPAHTLVDKSHKILVPYFPSNHQTEVVVEMSHCAESLRVLRKLVMEQQIMANLIIEVSFVRSDNIWLSSSYQRDSCHFTLMVYNPTRQTIVSYFEGFYQELIKLNFNPRLHFGKHFNTKPHQMYRVYPMLIEFMKIRKELDPNGMFLNQPTRVIFGF